MISYCRWPWYRIMWLKMCNMNSIEFKCLLLFLPVGESKHSISNNIIMQYIRTHLTIATIMKALHNRQIYAALYMQSMLGYNSPLLGPQETDIKDEGSGQPQVLSNLIPWGKKPVSQSCSLFLNTGVFFQMGVGRTLQHRRWVLSFIILVAFLRNRTL